MKNYFLISANSADFVQCGTTPPVFDAQQLVWITEDGNRYSAPLGYYTVTDDADNNPEVLAALKVQLSAAVTHLRYTKEVAGVVINGSRVNTDRESQATIAGAKCYVDLNPSATVDWKGEDGWVTLTKDAVYGLATAVGNYVQGLFTAEKNHLLAIEALTTLEQAASYDITTGWPQ